MTQVDSSCLCGEGYVDGTCLRLETRRKKWN